MVEDIEKAISKAKNILITSHISPDHDAIGSSLALRQILSQKKDHVWVSFEGELSDAGSFLKGFEEVVNNSLLNILTENKIDLLIVLDGNNYSRFTKEDPELVRGYVKENKVKTIAIDHHDDSTADSFNIYLNESISSVCELVYHLFIKQLKYGIDFDIAQCLMMGILSDTGGLIFKWPNQRKTFDVVADLLEEGVEIERLMREMRSFDPKELIIISELLKNTNVKNSYTYSYLTDIFYKSIQNETTEATYNGAYHHYMFTYLRNVGESMWGFVVLPDFGKKNQYKVSFRSVGDIMDTSVFARELGGNGHKAAAAARFKAQDYKEALEKIIKVIEKNG